jgi:hypothetical protein
VSKNVAQLTHSIDSVRVVAQGRSKEQSDRLLTDRYFGRENGRKALLPEVRSAEDKQRYDLQELWNALDVYKQNQVLRLAIE